MKTVFINGSPKKKMSVSAHLLGMLRLFVRGKVVHEQVRNQADHARVLDAIRDADKVIFGLPLYVDGVPSQLLAFMKEMEQFCKEQDLHPKVWVLANGGFIEGSQNKALMQVFECFCRRSGLQFGGGLGIGGGVMLNVLRILLLLYLALFALRALSGEPAAAAIDFAKQLGMILFFHLGVLFYGIPMGLKVNRGRECGVHYTRVMLPSFLFILVADIFFTLISAFKGGIFRGWLAKK